MEDAHQQTVDVYIAPPAGGGVNIQMFSNGGQIVMTAQDGTGSIQVTSGPTGSGFTDSAVVTIDPSTTTLTNTIINALPAASSFSGTALTVTGDGVDNIADLGGVHVSPLGWLVIDEGIIDSNGHTGSSGQVLTTNGVTASWTDFTPSLNEVTVTSGATSGDALTVSPGNSVGGALVVNYWNGSFDANALIVNGDGSVGVRTELLPTAILTPDNYRNLAGQVFVAAGATSADLPYSPPMPGFHEPVVQLTPTDYVASTLQYWVSNVGPWGRGRTS